MGELSLEDQVIEIIVDQLGVAKEEVTLNKSFIQDLDADSLDLTELIMTLEEKFEVEVSEQDGEKLKTVQDVVNYIKAHKK